MHHNDFFGSEKSLIFPKQGSVKIEFVGADGNVKVLKENLSLQAGEVFRIRNIMKFFFIFFLNFLEGY